MCFVSFVLGLDKSLHIKKLYDWEVTILMFVLDRTLAGTFDTYWTLPKKATMDAT